MKVNFFRDADGFQKAHWNPESGTDPGYTLTLASRESGWVKVSTVPVPPQAYLDVATAYEQYVAKSIIDEGEPMESKRTHKVKGQQYGEYSIVIHRRDAKPTLARFPVKHTEILVAKRMGPGAWRFTDDAGTYEGLILYRDSLIADLEEALLATENVTPGPLADGTREIVSNENPGL